MRIVYYHQKSKKDWKTTILNSARLKKVNVDKRYKSFGFN